MAKPDCDALRSSCSRCRPQRRRPGHLTKRTHLQEVAVYADRRTDTSGTSNRIASLDIVRGLAMILMTIDHVRVYSGVPAGGPTFGVFSTRWITNFVAPTFVFLAGTSAYLYGQEVFRSRGSVEVPGYPRRVARLSGIDCPADLLDIQLRFSTSIAVVKLSIRQGSHFHYSGAGWRQLLILKVANFHKIRQRTVVVVVVGGGGGASGGSWERNSRRARSISGRFRSSSCLVHSG